MKSSYFDQFWQSSSLDKYSLPEFGRQVENFDASGRQLQLEYPLAPTPLVKTRRSALDKLAARRSSQRSFSDQSLTAQQLSQLLGAARSTDGLDHRTYPSAGGSYASEVFCASWRARDFVDKLLYYEAADHAVVELAAVLPSWTELADQVNIRLIGQPALLIVIVIFPERLTAKYGERGGRFALLEAGALMQQFALSAAQQQLAGVQVGGLVDDYWRQLLGLQSTDARIAIGYAVGRQM